MTLRELLQSVDAEAYASIPLYEKLLKTRPEYDNIIYYVLKENLKAFGWSLEPMSSKKKPSRTIEQDLFGK